MTAPTNPLFNCCAKWRRLSAGNCIRSAHGATMAIMQSMRWAGAIALAATTLAAAGPLTVLQVKAPDVV